MAAKLLPFARRTIPEPHIVDYLTRGQTYEQWLAAWKAWDLQQPRTGRWPRRRKKAS